MIKRRLPLVMTVLAIGMLLALYLAVTSPRLYESVAVIQVEAPAIVDPDGDSGVPAARRVQLIEQRLMVRSNILDVIARHDLYEQLPLSINEKVALLRSSARIESVTATGRDPSGPSSAGALAAIVITVQAESAQKAADVANDFADSIINQDENNRQVRVQETREFLTNEESRIQQELNEHDQRIADFNAENEDSLPSAQQYIQTESTQLADQEATLDREIMSLDREKLAILAGGDSTVEGRAPSSLAQQLRAAELELAQARRTFAPDHPEIARLEESIRRLSQGGATAISRAVSEQTELIDSQIEQMRAQKKAVTDRLAQIELARTKTAEVLRASEALSREQRRLQDRFAETSRRLAEVEMLQSLQENNQTERLVVLERAVPPEYPALSGRKKSAVLGGFVSFVAALSLAFIAELRNPVLRNAGQFQRATGLRPVIELRYIPTEEDHDTIWRRRVYLVVLIFWTVLLAVWLIGFLPGIPSPGVVGPMGTS